MGFRIPNPKDPTDSYLQMLQNDTEEQRADARAAAQSNVAYNEALGQAPTNAINAWRQGRSFAEETNQWDRNAGKYQTDQALAQERINQAQLESQNMKADQAAQNQVVGPNGQTLKQKSALLTGITTPESNIAAQTQNIAASKASVSQGAASTAATVANLNANTKASQFATQKDRIDYIASSYGTGYTQQSVNGIAFDEQGLRNSLKKNEFSDNEIAQGARSASINPAAKTLAMANMDPNTKEFIDRSKRYPISITQVENAAATYKKTTGAMGETRVSGGALDQITAALEETKLPVLVGYAKDLKAGKFDRLAGAAFAGTTDQAVLAQAAVDNAVAAYKREVIADLNSRKGAIQPAEAQMPMVQKAIQDTNNIANQVPAAKRLENLNVGGQSQIVPASTGGVNQTSRFRPQQQQQPGDRPVQRRQPAHMSEGGQ